MTASVPTGNSAEGAASAFGAYLREQRKSAQLTLRQLADMAHVSNPYLSQLERGLHQPSVAVIRSLADALNISAEVLLAEAAGLRRAVGIRRTDDGRGVPGVEVAVRADDRLTPSRKTALIAVYRSMVDGG